MIRVSYEDGLARLQEEMIELLEKARTVCAEGMQKSDKLYRDLGWKDLSDQDLDKKIGGIQEAFQWISSNPKIQMLIDRGVMRSLYMLHKGDLPPAVYNRR